MKRKFTKIFLPILIIFILFSSCTSATSATSWTGIGTDGDTIYISAGSKIYAISSNNTLKWTFPSEADNTKVFWAEPAITKNQLIVGDYSNFLYNIDVTTGKENWTFDGSKGRYIGGGLIVGETILVPSTDNSLYALNLNKEQVWPPFVTSGALWIQPISDGEMVYFPSMDHNLYAVNIKTGKSEWTNPTNLGAAVLTKPVLSEDGYIFLSTMADEIIKVDKRDGKIVKRYKISKGGWSGITLYDNQIFVGDQSGTIYSLNSDNLNERWKKDAGVPVIGSAVVTGKGLVWISTSNEVISFDFNGNKLWTKTINGSLYSSPIIVKDLIVVAITGGDSLVIALDENGAEKWSYTIPK